MAKFNNRLVNNILIGLGLAVIIAVLVISINRSLLKERIVEDFDNTGNVIDTIINTTTATQEYMESVFSKVTNTDLFLTKTLNTKAIKAGGDISTTGNLTVGGKLTGSSGTLSMGNLSTDTITLNNISTSGLKIDNTMLKKLASQASVGGFAINGDGTTIPLMEGEWNLSDKGPMDAWTNDKWDTVHIYKGWRISVANNSNMGGGTKTVQNKTDVLQKYSLRDYGLDNKVSSYTMTWIGY